MTKHTMTRRPGAMWWSKGAWNVKDQDGNISRWSDLEEAKYTARLVREELTRRAQ